ncbi:IS256 family transposase [Candidatus Arsenophonus triatominarum]|uniref:IS256 family transposase n=1 Tax=Candidatus Arsenophonus triatominarum TaxID=57911 RepID=UPI0007C49961|nr:IS256 family transposase [Candidatus Arsenophonus triatominarum]
MRNQSFNFDEALKQLQSGKNLLGTDGILTPLIKQLTEAALQAEIEHYLSTTSIDTRKNGYTRKTVKSTSGQFELKTPRDRSGAFEPQLIKKNQTKLSEDIDNKILSLFALGMSYRDIQKHVAELYGLEISDGAITHITDKLLPELKAWQQRPLEALYPFVWLDAIHYKIKHDGHYINKAIYTVLGLTTDGHKELLGLYMSETEGAHHWLSVLTDLHNRGIQDILIACVDGLKGFPEAIASIFPQTEVQLCVVHQIRNSLRYIASKDQKAFMADLKPVYRADTKAAAELALDELETKWGEKYPIVLESWRSKWELLSAYFRYPKAIRKPIYTTNAVEAVHRQFRKLTKTKGAFPNENSLLKLLYIGINQVSNKWTMPISNWALTIAQLSIYFKGRLDGIIKI